MTPSTLSRNASASLPSASGTAAVSVIFGSVPERLMKNASIFQLRGGIDYQKLNLKHRAMMAFLYNRMKRLPDEQKTADMKTILETYHSAASFVDYHALEPIAKEV